MQSHLTRRLAIILCVTLAALAFFDYRLSQRGKWLPKNLPVEFGPWYAADMPLSRYALQMLGNPPAEGRRFTNLFNERVDAHIIATSSFDAYLEPLIVWAGYGYALTAEKKLDILGKAGPIRAMVLQSVRDGSRILMYYWIQNEDGMVTTRGSLRDYRDVVPRLRLGLTSIFQGKQSCIVRVYTQLHQADKEARQARRNMNEVARNLYESLRKQGSNGDKPVGSIVNVAEKDDNENSRGADISMLNSPLQADIPKNQRINLLPLGTGNFWDMLSRCQTPTTVERRHDKLVIMGQKTEGDVSGILMNLYREGKYWRREFYRKMADGSIGLVAMQDESSGLMRLEPPIPMWKEPVEEGQTLIWIGNFKLGKDTFASRAFSRVSAQENIKTSAGEFKAFRIDTIVLLNRRGQEIRFPMVRWMAPHVGYVSRGFADKQRPAFSELMRFEVK